VEGQKNGTFVRGILKKAKEKTLGAPPPKKKLGGGSFLGAGGGGGFFPQKNFFPPNPSVIEIKQGEKLSLKCITLRAL